jgi:hypothetical protein
MKSLLFSGHTSAVGKLPPEVDAEVEFIKQLTALGKRRPWQEPSVSYL